MSKVSTDKPSIETQPLSSQMHSRAMRMFMAVGLCSLLSLTVFEHYPNIKLFNIGIILGALIYFLLTDSLLRTKAKQQNSRVSLEQLSTLDAFSLSFAASYIEQSLYVCLIFLLFVVFSGILLSGLKKTLFDVLGFGSGILLSVTLIQEYQWQSSTSVIVIYGSILLIFILFICYAYIFHHGFTSLVSSNKKIREDQIRYKLRTYKLARYLTPTVWKAVVEGREDALRTERKRITMFFSDIAGFSSLSEELEAETLTDLLNTYLTEMSKIATKHKGTIDKFMGDGLMVLFGDTESAGLKADCIRGLSMAIEMRRKMKELETHWFNQGIKKPLTIRMGLNTGFCTVGSFGTSHYMDYTVLGTHVNLASRLESAADPGEILISYETWSLVKDVVMCRDKGEIKVKGFTHPIKVYQVVDFRKDLGRNQSYFQENTEGFSIHMDLDKIRNYDKDRIVEHLNKISEKLKDKIIS